MRIEDLGTLAYRDAWAVQEEIHAAVAGGEEERILLLEHPPVITLGRRPGVVRNLIASQEELAKLGVELIQSDRGGDITFHGPGQLVAYPIIRLVDHHLLVGEYVRALEKGVIGLLNEEFGLPARKDESGVGVWVDEADGAAGSSPAKICALGVRIKRGVSLHGIALNVTTDLRYFNLIVPCGLAGRGATSIQKLLGEKTPPMQAVKAALGQRLAAVLQAGARG